MTDRDPEAGLDLEFVRINAARGSRVIATSRGPADAADLNAIAADHPEV